MLNRNNLPLILLLSILITLLSCGGSSGNPNLPPDENPVDYKFAASDKSRDMSPDVSPDTLAEFVDGNSRFAFDLYEELKTEDGNLMYSPYSISVALAMTYAGANGNTAAEMADTMHYTLPGDKLHPTFNKLDLELQSRGEGASGADGEGFRLNIANSTWGQVDWSWLPEYLDLLAVNYGTGMRLVDFMNEYEECRLIINEWVAEKTEDRIKDLLAPGMLDSNTRLVLVNAIYFNAAWEFPFNEENTKPGDFYLLDGTAISTDMMHDSAEHRFYEDADSGFKAVELMYDEKELSMIIIVPDEGMFSEVEDSLDTELMESIYSGMRGAEVNLAMPKFGYESEFGLHEVLPRMGMVDAFGMGADFSKMDGTMRLYIDKVIHKSFIDVDEAGTEAAAATAVIMAEKGIPQFVELTIDRPFIYLIRDIETETILFVGRMVNPVG